MASSCCAAIACCIGHPSWRRLKLETLPLKPKTVIFKICLKHKVLAFLQLVFLFAQLPCSTQTLQYGNKALTNGKSTSSIYESILVRLLDHSYAHAMHLLDFIISVQFLHFQVTCVQAILPLWLSAFHLLTNKKCRQIFAISYTSKQQGTTGSKHLLAQSSEWRPANPLLKRYLTVAAFGCNIL